ncbi:PEP-CTERM/exosortase system-associated acyltransferase [Desulfobacter curvatus]|uniref:PEP-CTERM/exosortase system-associated acyltransferase n=1 Tax=Desulfobacter curvatus TaxID=2290 RepID=UPI0003685525|nr:PEP-CTERM/exosortase system-associated acyltransferase [Desulfobacter curvatus]
MELSFACINNDENKMEQAFKFRYEIFCEEKKFFEKGSFYGAMETDLFDQHSFHFAAFDQFENIKGYARLVCHSESGYPMQHLCPYEITGARDFIGESSAEISRLAIATGFRTFCQNPCMGSAGTAADNKKDYTDLNLPFQIQIGLYRMICAACLQLDIMHLFAVMEKSLYERLLSRFSLKFEPIGHGFENHGTVFPFLGSISEIEKSLFPEKFSPFQFQDRNAGNFYSDSPFFVASYEKVWA